jgi:hypothetical protein
MSGLVLRANHDLDPGHGVPSFWTHASAWLHRDRLDRELATGTPSWESPRHAARALQLTDRGQRRSLAQGLTRLLDEARHPSASSRRLSCIVPCRRSVLRCASMLEDLSTVLQSDLPLDAQQVARLRLLSRNGIGPFYCSGRDQELWNALCQITAGIVADD